MPRPVALRRVVSAFAVATLALVAGACSGDDTTDGKADSGRTTTTSTVAGRRTAGAAGDCPMRMPDELVPEIEAVVRFDVDRICPGYLKVAPGTNIRVRNESDEAADFRVEFGEATPGTVVTDEQIPAQGEVTVTVDSPGYYRYYTSVIPSFVGTFEVPST